MTHDTALPVMGQRADPVLDDLLPAPASVPPVRSLYIHIPFCTHKCHYCDFYSIVDQHDRQAAFVARLIRELRAIAPWAGAQPLETVFVGGGTPSLLEPGLWRDLLRALDDCFDLSRIRGGFGEFTVECNPESVTPELLGVLRGGGVDRLSLGAQSFEPALLQVLERRHDPDRVLEAIDLARRAEFERLSLDLISAIPGQSMDQFEHDLEIVVRTGVEHASCYTLTYEPNTPLGVRLRRGQVQPAPESLQIQTWRLAGRKLDRAGLARYEISNHARPGCRSQHNLAYWRGEQWLAAGPSASGHVAGHRWKNVPGLDAYLTHDRCGLGAIRDHEPPDPRRRLCEVLMMGLRLVEGVDARGVLNDADRIDPGLVAPVRAVADRWIDDGRLVESDGRWRLTEGGMLVADAVARDFLGVLC